MKKISGYRSYIFGWILIALGLYFLFLVPASQTGSFDAGQDTTRVILSNISIILGLCVIFIRMGGKNDTKKIIDEIRRQK